jgi:hypothetical protein
MRLKPELVPPDYPILTGYKLPGDKQTIQALTNNLSNLYRSSKQFSADVALYEWCGRMDSSAATADHFGLWYEWRFVAGRDGAFAARNYGKALEAVQALALRVKDLEGDIARSAFSEPRRLYHEAFPKIDTLRHSVAHPEFYANPRKNKPVSKDIPGIAIGVGQGASVTVTSGFNGDTFGATFDGEYVSYELSETKAVLLVDITKKCFAVFDPLLLRYQ